MATMVGLNWTSERQTILDQAIEEETENSRLAHKILPDFEIPATARSVSADTFDYATGTVDDEEQLAVDEPSETFVLSMLQVNDEDLSRAILGARRAAQRLARRHDEAAFTTTVRDAIDANAGTPGFHDTVEANPANGDGLVAATAAAVAALDGEGYREGYVMVASQRVYALLHTRVEGAADLPIKAVRGLLENGPVHRSAVLPDDEALVMSIGNGHVDRAVGKPPTLEFLRIENNDDHVFRVYERFRTRFKETLSVALIRLGP
jgi:Encapsulating protein for peroxidase